MKEDIQISSDIPFSILSKTAALATESIDIHSNVTGSIKFAKLWWVMSENYRLKASSVLCHTA